MQKHYLKLTVIVCLGIMAFFGCKKTPTTTSASDSFPEQPISEPAVVLDTEKPQRIRKPVMQEGEYTEYVTPQRAPRKIEVYCKFSREIPVIDGLANESVWQTVQPVTTLDFSSQRPIELRAIHDNETIYFLVQFPDNAPSRTHKSWWWDKEEQVYRPGNDREDMFVFRWRMRGDSISFSPDLVTPHTADVWFWKACRTNPAGYLDDKISQMLSEELPESTPVQSDLYGTLYLSRKGDSGQSAYDEKMFFDYVGDDILKFYSRKPTDSRADIRGKGDWKNRKWTIEVARRLDTGHADDISFTVGQSYLFGVCLYEMSAIPAPEALWFQPLYRTGNVFDTLILVIQKP